MPATQGGMLLSMPMTQPRTFSTTQQALGLIGWLLLAFAAAGVGGLASANAGDFYRELARPDWAPPGWLFGPVWTVLYGMMGVAAWLVWRAQGFADARWALTLFIVQLVANGLWSWLFFVWQQGALALTEITLLWLLIAATISLFWRISKTAAILLIPYLAWVTFASVLCFSLWRLNPQVLG